MRIRRRTVDQLELTGHDRRDADLDAIAALGVSAVRYPILWERVAPRGLATADWSWPDARLGRLRELGIRPILGLIHHGSGPRGMSLLHPAFPQAFAGYAAAVARRYPWIDAYVPINEPLTTARFGGLYGWWQPHLQSREACAALLLAQGRALRAASRAIKEVNPSATIIVNEDVGRTFSTQALAGRAAHMNIRRWLTWDLLFGRIVGDHPMYEMFSSTRANLDALEDLTADPEPPDVLGIDHYVTSDRFLDHRVQLYVAERRSPASDMVDVEASRVRGVPAGSMARAISDTWRRYHAPVALTEISLAGEPRDQVAWWDEAWRAGIAARERSIDLRAVTAWAAFGAVDWHCLMRRREDVYAPGVFDVRHDPPAERPVAKAIRASAHAARRGPFRVSRTNAAIEHEATSRYRGWWQRPNRFTLTLR